MNVALTHPAAIALSLALTMELGAPNHSETDGDIVDLDWEIAGGKAGLSVMYFGATDNLTVTICQDELRSRVRIAKGSTPDQIAAACARAVGRWVKKHIPQAA